MGDSHDARRDRRSALEKGVFTHPHLHLVDSSYVDIVDLLKSEINRVRSEITMTRMPSVKEMNDLVGVFAREVIHELVDHKEMKNVDAISYIFIRFARFFLKYPGDLATYFRALIGEMEYETQQLIADHIDSYFLNKEADSKGEQLDDVLAEVLTSFISDEELRGIRDTMFFGH